MKIEIELRYFYRNNVALSAPMRVQWFVHATSIRKNLTRFVEKIN